MYFKVISRDTDHLFIKVQDEALKLALELIPENSSVTMGGAMSAHEIGLVDSLKNDNLGF